MMAEIHTAAFWKSKYFPALSKSESGLIKPPRPDARFLNPGEAAIKAPFTAEKAPPIEARPCPVFFPKLSSEGLFC